MNKLKLFLTNVFASNRAFSFYWRTADMVVVAFADYATTEAGLFDLPSWAVVLLGLVLGELTKYFNKKANG